MLQKHGFYFCRSDGEAFVLDHLLGAIDNAIKSIAIYCRHIAGPVPSITQNSPSCIWSIPISQHVLRPSHEQFAIACIGTGHYLAFGLRHSLADRVRPIAVRLDISEVSDRRSLSHSVSLAQTNAG